MNAGYFLILEKPTVTISDLQNKQENGFNCF